MPIILIRPDALDETDRIHAMTVKLSLEDMRADIAEMVYDEPENIELDDNLMDLGLDSMRVMTLVERWDKKGVQLDFTRIAERLTLRGWWELAQDAQGINS